VHGIARDVEQISAGHGLANGTKNEQAVPEFRRIVTRSGGSAVALTFGQSLQERP